MWPATLMLLIGLSGCDEQSKCEEVCLRVSRCRKQAREGDPILGEGKLPPDARCMKRCRDNSEQFQKCELVKRNCNALRGCSGSLR